MAYATIRNGSSGNDVITWQKFLKVNADGQFGPATEAATKNWQQKSKLVADGIVGPASWNAAGFKSPTVTQKTATAPDDIRAYEISKRADPTLPEKQRQYVLTVARGEGRFGLAWATPSAATIAISQKLGLTGYEGKDSNNWGADQGSGSAGSFPHVDHGWRNPDGTPWNKIGPKVWLPYVGNYAKQKTPEEGFNRMKNIILNGGLRKETGSKEIKAAIEKGSLKDAVYAQYKNGYFELAPEQYLKAVLNNYSVLSVNTEWQKLLSEKGITFLKLAAGAAAGIASVVGLGVLAKKYRA